MRTIVQVIKVSVLAVMLASCGDRELDPVELRLADLVRFAEGYKGKLVATSGVVRSHPDPEHYWIEDEELNRIELRPKTAAAPLAGKSVRVVGRFRYPPQQGRSIEIDRVEVVTD